MDLFRAFNISASGLSAQRARMDDWNVSNPAPHVAVWMCERRAAAIVSSAPAA